MEVEPIPVAVIAALAAQLPPPITSTPEEIMARRAIRQAKLPPPQPWRKRRYVIVTEEPEMATTQQVEPEKLMLDVSFEEYRVVQKAGEPPKLFRHGQDTGHAVNNALLAAAYRVEELQTTQIVRKFTALEYNCMISLETLRGFINKLPGIEDTYQPQRLAELLHEVDKEIRVRPLMGALALPHFEPLNNDGT